MVGQESFQNHHHQFTQCWSQALSDNREDERREKKNFTALVFRYIPIANLQIESIKKVLVLCTWCCYFTVYTEYDLVSILFFIFSRRNGRKNWATTSFSIKIEHRFHWDIPSAVDGERKKLNTSKFRYGFEGTKKTDEICDQRIEMF